MVLSEAIEEADERCRATDAPIVTTPCVPSPALSAISGADVWFKHEQLQHTGSFKYRGALNKLLLAKARGGNVPIIAASSGNHGLAVARAALATGQAATVYVPEDADPSKKAGIQAAGATLETVSGDALEAELTARDAAEQRNGLFVSPYNDADVMAGQGTIGLELVRQLGDFDTVLAAVGGGGMLGGIGSALAGVGSRATCVGVWPKVACSMYRCLEAGEIIAVDEAPTLSDGTAGGVEPGAITFDVLSGLLEHQWLVSEADIARAMRWLADAEHLMLEGAAALAVAPLLAAKPELVGRRIVVILCGRNIALARFLAVIESAAER